MSMTVEPYDIAVPEAELEELHRRLVNVRWADDPDNADWRYGVERGWLEGMVSYWRDDFDWRAQERHLNRHQHYRATIDGAEIHFVHARSGRPDAIPLLLLHGWPWTFMDFDALLDPLSDPAAHGGDAGDAFDVVVPSLPGFGYSTLLPGGMTVPRLADVLSTLMTERLGYSRYAVGGGDWGAVIALRIAHVHQEQVVGALTTIPLFPGLDLGGIGPDDHASDEQWMIQRRAETQDAIVSHYTVQNHDPQTLAYALVDSPVGTAAWLWERRRSWSDCDGDVLSAFDRDALCAVASLYWFTRTIGTSLRIYWDNFHAGPRPLVHDRMPSVEVPTGIAVHPKEVMLVPRSVAARGINLKRWTVMLRGGHFGFAEQPDAMLAELRAFYRPLRGVP